ncbi:hypothetical protein ABT030_47885 [Streptomyces mirabilis]|uniref:hypothetical protein n=1 Tax=Streptomyces mirabilis TaxID=68239 RepID=UPI00331BF799
MKTKGAEGAQAQREAQAAKQQARQREEERQGVQTAVGRTEATLRQLEERAMELAQQLHATVKLRARKAPVDLSWRQLAYGVSDPR